MPKNHYERWTDQEIEEIVSMSANGMTHADIALVFGRTQTSITNVLHRRRKKAMKQAQPLTILDRIKRWLGIGK